MERITEGAVHLIKKEAEAARKALAEARSEMVVLGATAAENPAAALLGPHAETLQLAVLLGLPLWLELAAPVVLAYGFAPGPSKAPEPPKQKAKRRPAERAPRKPPGPAAKGARRPPPKLVAANDPASGERGFRVLARDLGLRPRPG